MEDWPNKGGVPMMIYGRFENEYLIMKNLEAAATTSTDSLYKVERVFKLYSGSTRIKAY